MKLKLAVIGKDVSRSTSPQIHKFIAGKLGRELEYSCISIPEEQFGGKIGSLFSGLDGFNVTIPYKLKIIPYLNRTEGDATVFGAVNTVTCRDLTGNNTDGLGFNLMLQNNGVDVKDKPVLLLGAGGAGRSVAKKLMDGGAKLKVFDVNAGNVAAVCAEFGAKGLNQVTAEPYYMIVNATGVGMHKSEGISPVGADILSRCEVACDLIYVPAKSRFLELAEESGKKIINGAGMLFYQAYYAQCIFFGAQPAADEAKKLFEEYSKEKYI